MCVCVCACNDTHYGSQTRRDRCLDPPLLEPPPGAWRCPICAPPGVCMVCGGKIISAEQPSFPGAPSQPSDSPRDPKRVAGDGDARAGANGPSRSNTDTEPDPANANAAANTEAARRKDAAAATAAATAMAIGDSDAPAKTLHAADVERFCIPPVVRRRRRACSWMLVVRRYASSPPPLVAGPESSHGTRHANAISMRSLPWHGVAGVFDRLSSCHWLGAWVVMDVAFCRCKRMCYRLVCADRAAWYATFPFVVEN